MNKLLTVVLTLACLTCTTLAQTANPAAPATAPAAKVRLESDVPFAEFEYRKLLLNLRVPQDTSSKPRLIVYIHGGAWTTGSYKDTTPNWLTNHGYAVASISYRFSTQATFPAQIHDCKGAIRWLRAHAPTYGYDASRIAVMGSSAGAHLAMLLGTTNGNKELEGDIAGNLDQSSDVQCVIDFFGPSDFILRATDQPSYTDTPAGRVYKLLGKSVKENEDFAKLASPAWQVSKDDVPLIIFHGNNDKTVRVNQAVRMRDAYQSLGLPVELHIIPGGDHGGSHFRTPDVQQAIVKFLEANLQTTVANPR